MVSDDSFEILIKGKLIKIFVLKHCMVLLKDFMFILSCHPDSKTVGAGGRAVMIEGRLINMGVGALNTATLTGTRFRSCTVRSLAPRLD